MRIKELIKEKGYTQQEFADKLGMSRVGLSQIINGKPSYQTMEKLAEALGVEIVELFNMPKNTEFHCPNCGATLELKVKEE
ncbi:MAG: helix-turn-helix transcriptional regulator [Rikenellaceae bacterium]